MITIKDKEGRSKVCNIVKVLIVNDMVFVALDHPDYLIIQIDRVDLDRIQSDVAKADALFRRL